MPRKYFPSNRSALHPLLSHSPPTLLIGTFQPADWNRITFSQLKKAVRLPVSITKPEVIERLKEKYPEYEWSNQNLLEKKRGTQGRKRDSYWMDPQNRRRLFVELAHTKGFDPMVPKNWRGITSADIVTQGVTKKATNPVKTHSLYIYRARSSFLCITDVCGQH